METVSFIHEIDWQDFPETVRHQAVRCLLDTVGTAVAGRQTDLSPIIYDFAAAAFGGNSARLWLDGRPVSPSGAALAHGMTIDALDIHDGYTLVKGHIGAAVTPAAMATLSLDKPSVVSGRELLVTLVMGYEIAARAGRALHRTASDYHTSGAWNALAAAAVTVRRLRLTSEQTRHALGIAEYHGPRSQMMRCIDHPTMVKDGSGWGAMAGVSAAILASAGFTGAPAVTIEGSDVADLWSSLGQEWLILQQYFKPYAVCRWAQPAIVGTLALRDQNHIAPEAIRSIRVHSFHEATRLVCRRPKNTEEAQYSLPFPVAASLVHGRLGPAELSGAALSHPLVLKLASCVELVDDAVYSSRFPARRYARVEVETIDGVHDSGPVEATWGADDPPIDAELKSKFRWLVGGMLCKATAVSLEECIWQCADLEEAETLNNLLTSADPRG